MWQAARPRSFFPSSPPPGFPNGSGLEGAKFRNIHANFKTCVWEALNQRKIVLKLYGIKLAHKVPSAQENKKSLKLGHASAPDFLILLPIFSSLVKLLSHNLNLGIILLRILCL